MELWGIYIYLRIFRQSSIYIMPTRLVSCIYRECEEPRLTAACVYFRRVIYSYGGVHGVGVPGYIVKWPKMRHVIWTNKGYMRMKCMHVY